MTIIRRVVHSTVMYETVLQLLRDFLPAGQEFVIRNLNALVRARHRAQIVSLVILLITSTVIFMPLEVALNRIWKFPSFELSVSLMFCAFVSGLLLLTCAPF